MMRLVLSCLLFVSCQASVVGSRYQTCGQVKSMYKANSCCKNPDKHADFQMVPHPQRDADLVNPCAGKKPKPGGDADANPAGNFDDKDCLMDGAVNALEQAGADVSEDYIGGRDVEGRVPITKPYYKTELCPVNVHWHLGAEHRSQGQFDETEGKTPSAAGTPLADVKPRYGFACKLYDATMEMFTKAYEWHPCEEMHVGATYEIHWPHSTLGACGTPNQYQTPFYDGVFCNWNDADHADITSQNLALNVGVQSQVFTIVNEEKYYYPDLIRGMIVDGEMGKNVAKYTGSTTGTKRNNVKCSSYSPITWQVDRTCHLISASSFDKMCADMKQMRDDMSGDLHPHGSRELVDNKLAANNKVNP